MHCSITAHPPDLRKIVYSTNAIESLNARFRKAAVRRGHFPTEQAALKVLYLVSIERKKNRTNPTGRINGWKAILNTLTIHYSDRLAANNLKQRSPPFTHTLQQSPSQTARRSRGEAFASSEIASARLDTRLESRLRSCLGQF